MDTKPNIPDGFTMRAIPQFWQKVNVTQGCWIWESGLTDKGYGRFNWIDRHGIARHARAHRLAWVLTNGPIPEGMCVCHKCDVPGCVNPDHLFLGTNAENIRDRGDKGRSTCGSRCPRSKLTEESVAQIRMRRALGFSRRVVAMEFGVSTETIKLIDRGITWKHVLPDQTCQEVPSESET